MRTEVRIPPLSETMEEGRILGWRKAEGERVEADEALFELETDKANVEVPSPVAGVVRRILVRSGETATVGTVVAVIDPDEEA